MNADVVSVGGTLPTIAGAVVLDARKVKLLWKSGKTTVVDLAPVVASRRIYAPLRGDDVLFSKLRVSEFGDALEWPGDIELSAIWVARLPEAEFTNDEFREAMALLGMSLDGMADNLQISRRLVADYRKDKPIPKHIAYATRYLVEHERKNEEHRAGA